MTKPKATDGQTRMGDVLLEMAEADAYILVTVDEWLEEAL